MVIGLCLQLRTRPDMDKRRRLFGCPIWSVLPVGCSHPDSVALSTLKAKEEKIVKLATLAFFHRDMDRHIKFRLSLIY